ncbi:MAG: hypothetical protein OCC45_15440 [Desulfotalea sp.]
MSKKIAQHFERLELELTAVNATKKNFDGGWVSGDIVDEELFISWKLRVKALFSMVCGENSQHFKAFEQGEKPGLHELDFSVLTRLGAIFHATKQDFEDGFLTSIKKLVQAEVFESELEQANELLGNGYKLASAVVAGVVLETSLRDMCDSEEITHGKLDSMNSQLAKAGVYSKLQQKRITALADIRNSAAHGKTDEFNNDDVKNMIRDIESFLISYLA